MADWFDEDPFDDIIKNFFGQGGLPRSRYSREAISEGEEEQRVIDFIENGKSAYLIFELPGYVEEDLDINAEGNKIEINVGKKDVDGIKEYLAQKLSQGITYTKSLPNFINPKTLKYTLKNGILEIKFDKKSK